MNAVQIKQSLFTFVFGAVTGEKITTGKPSTLDPMQDEAQEFVCFYIELLGGNPCRKGVDEHRVEVQVESHSRSKDDIYAADKLLQKVMDKLQNYAVPVHDYETSGEPQIGYVQFREFKGDYVKQSGADQWDIRMGTITGIARTGVTVS